MLTLPPSIIEETRNTMTDVFVIRNQLGHYWAKSKTWVDGSEARAVMRAKHEDEAVNTLFELGSKDFELRGEVVAAELSERGEPIIETSQIPLLMEQEAEPESDADATADKPTESIAEVTTEKPANALD
jgi:hypothetical protein